jgi:hypothetical protein
MADPITNPPAYASLVSIVQRDLQREEEQAAASSESTRPSFFRRSSTWVAVSSILVGSGVATFFALGGADGGSYSGGLPVLRPSCNRCKRPPIPQPNSPSLLRLASP